MSDKVKNIISNILGLIVIGISIYAYLFDMVGLSQFSVVLVVGLGLFLFKASKTRSWLNKFLSKKLK
jgi:hypothetical protein